jgi:hypothetical protein
MNTYAIQLELHFQSDRSDDDRFGAFVEDVKAIAAKHGIDFGDFQSMQLPASDFTINGCASCGHLTVNRANVQPDDENMLPDFWFYVRRGNLVADSLLCDFCRPIAHAPNYVSKPTADDERIGAESKIAQVVRTVGVTVAVGMFAYAVWQLIPLSW